ncbi:PREDICTED: uncharacterized protein LOC109346351 isoform X1 [Lupinus angustifolius]|uniref:uncharacterized protein LOC109346351 isoform X1 n=1 Tax=Lupinus angustifolius TaxID=3871 RepID=UPI00092F228B|nr:PREDICTED: uncharacterized protein LOC109346351 isoform X1 [Lupinus angustifolius]XP_019441405.1 PREDICTED: uncharacterized protein LOC109346351 isoform X1 [Lupinus angustifolius]
MAMGPERSKSLHNFMLPCLKWGNQRHLRCMKVPTDNASNGGDHRSPAPSRKRELEPVTNNATVTVAKPGIDGDDDGGIDAVREKLMLDLKTEAHRMKDAILGKGVAEENGDGDVAVAAAAAEELVVSVGVRPWNLRTRRSACPEKGLKIEEKKTIFSSSSPLRTNNNNNNVGGVVMKSPKLRGTPEKIEKVKFSVPLSRKEIEDDFMKLLGHRPPRRPKKRARIVQKQLDTLFPGLWLSEVTADSYKVPEAPETGKR